MPWKHPHLILAAFDKGIDVEPYIFGVLHRCTGWDFDLLLKVFGV